LKRAFKSLDPVGLKNFFFGTVGEYTTSGATVNASLVPGLSGPFGIAVSGSDLFIMNYSTGTIGEYTLVRTFCAAGKLHSLSVILRDPSPRLVH
jgi:hypothetical protein